MRRAILASILLLASISLFAAAGSALDAYSPIYTRNLAMGGTGVASSRYGEVLYSNPALIGVDNQYFSTPHAALTLFNLNKLVQPGGALDILLTQNDGDGDVNRALNQIINSIGSGSGDVLSAQTGLGFISGIVGLSMDGQLDLHSIGSGGESSTLVLESNLAITLGLSLPFTLGENHHFSTGVSGHLVFRGFTIQDLESAMTVGGFTASRLMNAYMQEDTVAAILNTVPIAFGFAIPLDFGISYSYRDVFSLGLVLKNFNGRYYMQSYSAVNQLYYMLTGGYIGQTAPGNPQQGESYSFDSPMSLDAGFSLSTPAGGFWDWVDLTLAIDMVDLLGLTFDSESLIQHLRIGAELSLMRTFDFRVGINSGYLSLGFAFDFQIFTLDILYCTQEYGESLGDKPLDFLTIALRLGLES